MILFVQRTFLTVIRVVFVIMLLSSIAFYIMAFRVPVVRAHAFATYFPS